MDNLWKVVTGGTRNVRIMVCAPVIFSTLQATWNGLFWNLSPRLQNLAKKQKAKHSSPLTELNVYYSLYKSAPIYIDTQFTLIKL